MHNKRADNWTIQPRPGNTNILNAHSKLLYYHSSRGQLNSNGKWWCQGKRLWERGACEGDVTKSKDYCTVVEETRSQKWFTRMQECGGSWRGGADDEWSMKPKRQNSYLENWKIVSYLANHLTLVCSCGLGYSIFLCLLTAVMHKSFSRSFESHFWFVKSK